LLRLRALGTPVVGDQTGLAVQEDTVLEGAVGGAIEHVVLVAGGQTDGCHRPRLRARPSRRTGAGRSQQTSTNGKVAVRSASHYVLLVGVGEGVRVALERSTRPYVAENRAGGIV
jgi:hypothetical protein